MHLGGEYLNDDHLRAAGFRSVGKHVRVHSRASLYHVENISLGDHVRIDDFAVIVATGPVDVGNYVHVPNFCFIGAGMGVVLRDFTTLAPGVQIYTKSDDYSGRRLTGPLVPARHAGGRAGLVVLNEHVIVGANSVILPGCTLGEGCSVGALSLVKEDTKPWTIYAGVPVKALKERRRDLLELRAKFLAEEGRDG